jgi:hypothetical protein
VPLGTTDTSTCDLNLAGVDGQVGCLDCSAVMGGVQHLEYTTFDNCDATGMNGWALLDAATCADSLGDCTMGTEDQPCCYNADPAAANVCVTIPLNPPLHFLRTNKQSNCGGGVEEWRLQKTFDFTGMTGIEFCLDIASQNANDNQAVAVTAYDTLNPTPEMFLCQFGEPRQTVDGEFYRFCGMLPAWADDSPDTTISIIAHSENNGRMMFVDNISIHAWNDACTPSYLTVLTEDFTGCNDPLDGASGWAVTGTVNCTVEGFDCFDASERVWVEGNSGTITRWVDTSALTGDVVLCFFYGDGGADGGKSLEVQFSTNGTDWLVAWDHSGDQRPDNSCHEVCVNLTDLDPLTAGNPTLGIMFDLTSGRDPIYLDHITLRGAEACDAAGIVDLSTLTDNSDGTYTFTAQDTAGTPVDVSITCTWDNPPAGDEVEGTESLSFQ